MISWVNRRDAKLKVQEGFRQDFGRAWQSRVSGTFSSKSAICTRGNSSPFAFFSGTSRGYARQDNHVDTMEFRSPPEPTGIHRNHRSGKPKARGFLDFGNKMMFFE